MLCINKEAAENKVSRAKRRFFPLETVSKMMNLCTRFVSQKPSLVLFLIITWLFAAMPIS